MGSRGDRPGRSASIVVPTAAHASWRPIPREQAALAARSYVDSLGRVDQMWPWLATHHADVMAVDAPHAAHPERFTYAELEARISAVAAALRALGAVSYTHLTLPTICSV